MDETLPWSNRTTLVSSCRLSIVSAWICCHATQRQGIAFVFIRSHRHGSRSRSPFITRGCHYLRWLRLRGARWPRPLLINIHFPRQPQSPYRPGEGRLYSLQVREGEYGYHFPSFLFCQHGVLARFSSMFRQSLSLSRVVVSFVNASKEAAAPTS